MQNKCDAFSVLLKLTPTQQAEVLQMTILKQLDNFCSEKSVHKTNHGLQQNSKRYQDKKNREYKKGKDTKI